MPKLKLDLDQLTVDSFDTADGRKREGTVFGEQCTCHTNCTCPGCPTCDATCDTCDATCEASCTASCVYTCYYESCNYCATHHDPTCGTGSCVVRTECVIVP